MKYLYKSLEQELAACNPVLQQDLAELDAWLKAQDWPELTMTHVLRSVKEQRAIYNGEKDFSEHMVGNAGDFRNRVYSADQISAILAHLYAKHGKDWRKIREILSHDVGRGPHFHYGVKDPKWKRQWMQKNIA